MVVVVVVVVVAVVVVVHVIFCFGLLAKKSTAPQLQVTSPQEKLKTVSAFIMCNGFW